MRTSDLIRTIVELTIQEFYDFKAIAKDACIQFTIEDTTSHTVAVSLDEEVAIALGYTDLMV
jgi:hypothetical protein